MYYGSERFIKAHQDISNPYYNYSYDRYVRDAFCGACGKLIGEQEGYPDFDNFTRFYFFNEKDNYMHCPYCGNRFEKIIIGGV